MDNKTNPLQASYDRLAEKYAEIYFHELEHKPLDRELLNRLIHLVDGLGPICDLGCGPGQIARYLSDGGVDALGVDLSGGMIKVAQRLSPHIEFKQGNMLSLDFDDNSLGGIAAFYSIIHIPHEAISDALLEMKRVLKLGGIVLISFHIGEEIMHLDELWGEQVDMDFIYFPVEEIESYIKAAAFEHLETVVREPYPDVEYQSRRGYIFARKPHS